MGNLIWLYLHDWQNNSNFTLVINLNQLDAELVLLGQPAAKGDDKIEVSVYTLNGELTTPVLAIQEVGGVDINGNSLLNTTDRTLGVTISALSNLPAGDYTIVVKLTRGAFTYSSKKNIAIPDPVAANQPLQVDVLTTTFSYTPAIDLWKAIKARKLDFQNMREFVNIVLCKEVSGFPPHGVSFNNNLRDKAKNRLPFVNVDEYSLVKYAIDAYLRKALKIEGKVGNYSLNPLPYYQHLNQPLMELADDYLPGDAECKERLDNRLNGFLAIELIWSYWTEQAMLVQAIGAISSRYQNIRGQHEVEPMMRFDTSPLLPLSNIMWGFIQDEPHRTSINRRSFEYQHAYDTRLIGKAVPKQIGVDNRSNFLSAFHNLLHQASLFYKEIDDKMRQADAFTLLIALRDVHLLLAEGNHNAYYNMTYTTRHEMLTMQYLLSQPEMQTFLGGRAMMPYEPHVGALDTIKTIQGWDPVGTTHYYELANAGEQILLGIRYGDWYNGMFTAADAGTWAIAFRDLISTYINAYRNVTMVDLSADASRSSVEERAIQPALLIQRRMSMMAPRRTTAQQQCIPSGYGAR